MRNTTAPLLVTEHMTGFIRARLAQLIATLATGSDGPTAFVLNNAPGLHDLVESLFTVGDSIDEDVTIRGHPRFRDTQQVGW